MLTDFQFEEIIKVYQLIEPYNWLKLTDIKLGRYNIIDRICNAHANTDADCIFFKDGLILYYFTVKLLLNMKSRIKLLLRTIENTESKYYHLNRTDACIKINDDIEKNSAKYKSRY